MKERPILFSGPMVRALLNGSKTQTRRIVKLPHANPLGKWEVFPWGGPNGGRTREGHTVPFQNAISHSRTGEIHLCPHGQPGDRLWVRETHLNWWKLAADNNTPEFSHVAAFAADGYELQSGEKWIPSIHMLRAASRITLEIVSVRVERLQEISEPDAVAEGIEFSDDVPFNSGYFAPGSHEAMSAADAYRALWEYINGAGAWDANPWVWVVEFKKVAA